MTWIHRWFKIWENESRVPVLIIGYFAWWTKCHLCTDFVGSLYHGQTWLALSYLTEPTTLGFRNLPDLFWVFTWIPGVMALAILVWLRPQSLWGRFTGVLAAVTVAASIGYSVYVQQMEEQIVSRAFQERRYLKMLKAEDSNFDKRYYDSMFLRKLDEALKKYLEANP